MPSLADSAVIFILALILFGPKRLPQLARQLGKLMAEFRRASNEFRMQMEDEMRMEEQKEHQAKIAALPDPPSSYPDTPHPHLPAPAASTEDGAAPTYPDPVPDFTPAPIAEAGELKMMPPSTGLPVESAARGNSIWNGNGAAHSLDDPHLVSNEPVADIYATEPEVGMSSEEPAAEHATTSGEHHA